jgi:hypothetical protein
MNAQQMKIRTDQPENEIIEKRRMSQMEQVCA